jgi:hypothetical protein
MDGTGSIILNEVSSVQKAKGHVFSHMWNIGPIQIQQYYEKQVTLRGGHIQKRGRVKEES